MNDITVRSQVDRSGIPHESVPLHRRRKAVKAARPKYRFQFLFRPGLRMKDEALRRLVSDLRETAATCFETIPEYQALSGLREELSDTIISIARRRDGKIAGFCSTVILSVEGVGFVQHLGLTCVRPEDRSNGLTHELTRRAVAGFLLRYRPIVGRLWISNCAAVLSSLVNVALYFEEVYPSPNNPNPPSEMHRAIARAIDEKFRHKIYINNDAVFEPHTFVFRKSVKGTVFQKDEDDEKYFHRNKALNEFYRQRMNFIDGDEVLQVGYATTGAAIRHILRKIPIGKERKAKNH